MFRRIRDLFTSGERVLFGRILQLIILSEKSLRNLDTMIRSPRKEPKLLKTEMGTIAELEKEGDALAIKLTQSITRGAIAPGLTEHFFTLIQRIDDILDTSHFLARDISRVSTHATAFGSSFCVQVYQKAAELHALCLEGTLKLKELIEGIDEGFDASIERTRELEEIEERVDDMKEEILDGMYEGVELIDWWVFEHLVGLIRRLDDISDLCEDCGNEITMILTQLGA